MNSQKANQERRKHDRIQRNYEATIVTDEGQVVQGTLKNLSEDGVYIEMKQPFSEGTPISFQFVMSGVRIYIQGSVVWRNVDAGSMGVRISEADKQYIAQLSNLRSTQIRSRRSQDLRYTVHHKVTFESDREFLTEYTVNLSRGGMYLSTTSPMPEGSPIRAEIEIPGMDETVSIQGVVVYKLGEKEANEKGFIAGMGVQFVELGHEAKSKLSQYLGRLDIYQSSSKHRLAEAIPLKGTLKDFIVPELLANIYKLQKSGCLILQRKGVVKKVFFKNGQPIYVDSNARSETLGHYLLRVGTITYEQFEKSLDKMVQSDLKHGEVLIECGFVTPTQMAQSLIEHQEEKICNTFGWFDGDFSFETDPKMPSNLSIFALRPYQILLEGIRNWYTLDVVQAWMGIHESTMLISKSQPRFEVAVPSDLSRILSRLKHPKTIKQLSNELGIKVSKLVPSLFALIIPGWVELAPESDSRHAAHPKTELKSSPQEASEKLIRAESIDLDELKERIRVKYQIHAGMDFYEMLGVKPGSSEDELKAAYMKRISEYQKDKYRSIKDPDTKMKISQILSWLDLAMDTLSDPKLRSVYARRGLKAKHDKSRSIKLDIERMLLRAIRDLKENRVERAKFSLEKAIEKYPKESSFKGYLGWALFAEDAAENADQSLELLESAVDLDGSDHMLWFFVGKVASYLKKWKKAERACSRALRIYPNFAAAKAMQEEVAQKLIQLEKHRQALNA